MADGVREAEQLGVFISYSRRDSLDFADQLAKALDMLGYRPILDREGISAGEEWKIRLGQMVLECDTVVFVMSPESAVSPICVWEVEEAARLSKRILPVIAMPLMGKSPPERLQRLNFIHFHAEPDVPGSGFGDGLVKLNTALKSDVEWLREHRNMLLRAEAWEAKERDPDRLLRGGPLAEAERWLAGRPVTAPDITATQRAYLEASRAAEDEGADTRRKDLEERERLLAQSEAAQKRAATEQAAREAAQREAADLARQTAELAQREAAQARTTARPPGPPSCAALVLSVAAGGAGFVALTQQREAQAQADMARVATADAESARRSAETARGDAQLNLSRFLADLSRQATQGGDAATGLLVALEALPDTDSDDHSARTRPVWPPADASLSSARRMLREQLLLKGHSSRVSSVAFTQDGSRIITGSGDGTARIWDASTGNTRATLRGHRTAITSVAVTRDGSRIVTGSTDSTAIVWDAATGSEVLRIDADRLRFRSVAFTPDGARVIAALQADEFSFSSQSRGRVRVWDIATGAATRQLEGEPANFLSVMATSDGARIITTEGSSTFDPFLGNVARVWDLATGKEVGRLTGHTAGVTSAATTKDGSKIVTASIDRTVRIWNASTFAEIAQLKGHDGAVSTVALSPDDSKIFSGSADGTIRVWDLSTGNELAKFRGHVGEISSVAIAPGGERLVTGGDDNTARIWSTRTTPEDLRLTGHSAGITSVATSSDGSRIVTGSSDNSAIIWDALTGNQLLQIRGHSGSIWGVAFSADNGRVATASWDDTVGVWDSRTGAELMRFRGHTADVNSVAFLPDGTRVVSGADDRTARIWDARTGKERIRLTGHTDWVTAVNVTHDGTRILTGSNDRTARIWDALTGAQITLLKGHNGPVTSISGMPDGKTVVTGSADGTARLWDLSSGREILQINGHTNRVTSVAVTRDGTRIITGSGDRTVRFWNAGTGTEVARIDAHGQPIVGVAVSPSGATIVTGSEDRTAKTWRVFGTGQQLVRETKKLATRCLTPAERRRHYLHLEPPSWCLSEQRWPYDSVGGLVEATRLLRTAGSEQYEEAQVIFDSLLKRQPSLLREIDRIRIAEFLQNGANLLRQNRDGDAETQFALVLKHNGTQQAIDAKYAEAFLARAETMLGDGDWKEGEALLEKAVGLDGTVASKADDARRSGYRAAWRKANENAIALRDRGEHVAALLAAMKSYFDLTLDIHDTRALNQSNVISIWSPISVLHAGPAGKVTDPANVNDCDQLAGFPFDPMRGATGVAIDKIDVARARAACDKAIAEQPKEFRYWFQRARVGQREFRTVPSDQRARRSQIAASTQADIAVAMAEGYAMAFNTMAVATAQAEGVASDEAKASQLYLETLNRVLHCCWAPVARRVLGEADKHDRVLVQRVVSELSQWSAALGSEASKVLLAELAAEGTLAPVAAIPAASFTDLPPWLR